MVWGSTRVTPSRAEINRATAHNVCTLPLKPYHWLEFVYVIRVGISEKISCEPIMIGGHTVKQERQKR